MWHDGARQNRTVIQSFLKKKLGFKLRSVASLLHLSKTNAALYCQLYFLFQRTVDSTVWSFREDVICSAVCIIPAGVSTTYNPNSKEVRTLYKFITYHQLKMVQRQYISCFTSSASFFCFVNLCLF